MTQSYDSRFRKIVALEELAAGTPRVFQSGGAAIVLLRNGATVEAIDGSCLEQDQTMSLDQKLRSILSCVGSTLPTPSSEWADLLRSAGLPTRVEDGWVWVCLDDCKPAGA